MKRLIILSPIVLVLLIGIRIANAQRSNDPTAPDSGYDLLWNTIDSSGETIGNGTYALDGTLGQADAAQLSNSTYSLVGGFWSGTVVQYQTYLPLALKSL
jgi:hypothetical protein